MQEPSGLRATRRAAWLTQGAGAIGVAHFLSDVGHEVPTSLLPSLLTVTLGARRSPWD